MMTFPYNLDASYDTAMASIVKSLINALSNFYFTDGDDLLIRTLAYIISCATFEHPPILIAYIENVSKLYPFYTSFIPFLSKYSLTQIANFDPGNFKNLINDNYYLNVMNLFYSATCYLGSIEEIKKVSIPSSKVIWYYTSTHQVYYQLLINADFFETPFLSTLSQFFDSKKFTEGVSQPINSKFYPALIFLLSTMIRIHPSQTQQLSQSELISNILQCVMNCSPFFNPFL